MIAYLVGKIKFLFEDSCILLVNGVGYKVFINERTRKNLNVNQEVEFFTYTAVREDSITLYGLENQNDYELFTKLITVSGIGARTALNILSKISSRDLALAIHQKNVNTLTTLPGVGKKSAQRLILELKEKISAESLTDSNSDDAEWKMPTVSKQNALEEAAEALTALGYTNLEISEVLKKAKKSMTTEEIVKLALKELNRF